MTSPQIIQQGAEAIISLKDNQISKLRTKKSYRISELDEKIRKSRTKAEAKIIEKLKDTINVPKIMKVDEKNKEIFMEYIDGKKLSENLEKLDYKKICRQIADEISKVHDKDIIHGDLTTSNMIWVENPKNIDIKISSSAKHQNLQINNIKNSSFFAPTQNNFTDKDLIINKNITRNKRAGGAYEEANEKSISEANADNQGKVYFIDFGLGFHSKKIEDKAVDLHLLKQALEAKHYKISEEAVKIIFENYKADKNKEIIQRIKTIELRGRYRH